MKKRPSKGKKGLTIVFAASECAPFSKTGGLGDVAGALPAALAALGHEVHLFTPLYDTVDQKGIGLSTKRTPFEIPISARRVTGAIRSLPWQNMTIHFVENNHYYHRGGIYTKEGKDFPDNLERFVFFCRAVLESTQKLKLRPDVMHTNDWQSALIPVYLKTLYRNVKSLSSALSLITIHNLGYQGIFPGRQWHLTGLDWSLFHPLYLEFYHDINLLKGGLIFSDLITTVSPTYAKEIQTSTHGFGLDPILHQRRDDLKGLLNGIDTEVWNPATDPHIAAHYQADDLSGKAICKKELMAEMGIKKCKGPLFGIVSRLVEQKGLDLLLPIIDQILDRGAGLVVVGTGSKVLEKGFSDLAIRRPSQVAVRLRYDERLAHAVEAGSDVFLMPSRYEPCGLNQLYSLRYGTAPLVRATGGLNDSVTHFNPATGEGNGFTFSKPSSDDLRQAIQGAIDLYCTNQAAWKTMISNGMRAECGWTHSARDYTKLYGKRSAPSS